MGVQEESGTMRAQGWRNFLGPISVLKTIPAAAHKDGDHLVEFVSTAGNETGKSRLKEVFAVMGEPGASMHLAQRINDELAVKAIMPERGKAYELE